MFCLGLFDVRGIPHFTMFTFLLGEIKASRYQQLSLIPSPCSSVSWSDLQIGIDISQICFSWTNRIQQVSSIIILIRLIKCAEKIASVIYAFGIRKLHALFLLWTPGLAATDACVAMRLRYSINHRQMRRCASGGRSAVCHLLEKIYMLVDSCPSRRLIWVW